MTATATAITDPRRDRADHLPGHGEGGPAPRHVIVGYGFWIFLLSDIVMFSALFAGYAVLAGNTAGGPAARDLFELPLVFAETVLLLLSSFTCGLMNIAASRRNMRWTYAAGAATFVLGAAFLSLELYEFGKLIGEGAGPQRSAFLSAFFTLVGAHGVHVAIGLFALVVMMAQVATMGWRADVERRLFCFGLYWHALDIIWVAVFTIVYLYGMMR